MKAVAAFPAVHEVRVIDAEPPSLERPDDVLLRLVDVGICGTDREICTFEYGTPPPGADHLVLGHEALAEVVEVGPAVAHLGVGDLVVPSVRRPCRHDRCRACRTGHQDFCYTGDFTERGIKEAHGYMTELVVDAGRYMTPVPQHLRSVAVLTEPLTIAEKALAQLSWLLERRPPWVDPDVAPDERGRGLSALVLGLGPVGILGAMTLVAAGFETFVYSREVPPSDRTDLVGAIGATYVSSQASPFDELAARIGNIDVVYEAAGQSSFALEALHVLGTNGVYLMTGVPGLQDLVASDPATLMRTMVLKNQVLLGTVNAGPEAFAAALRDLDTFSRRWPDVTASLIAGRHPPEEAARLVHERPTGIKTVISFDGAG